MPGRAAEQDERAGHEAAAEHAVELADAGLQARRRARRATSRRRTGAAAAPARAGAAARAARRGRRALLDQRVPLAAARALPVPLGSRVRRTGADVDRCRAGHGLAETRRRRRTASPLSALDRVERAGDVGEQVLGVLDAGAEADEALGATSSVPQRARRSAVECTPPKLVASATSSQAAEERLRRASASRERRSATTQPTPGQRTSVDVVARRAAASASAARVGAPGARARSAERRQRAVRQPGLERARRSRPSASRHARSAARALGVAGGDVAEQQVAVAGERASCALATETSAPSSSGRWRSGVASVLSTATQRARLARGAAPAPAMSITSRPGFDGVSTHTIVAPPSASRTAASSVGTSRTSTPRGCEVLARDRRARRGSRRRAPTSTSPARRPASSTAVTAAMPEAKSDRLAALELAQRALVARPRSGCRRARSRRRGVDGVAGEVERRGEHRARAGTARPARAGGSPAWTDAGAGSALARGTALEAARLVRARRRRAWSRELPAAAQRRSAPAGSSKRRPRRRSASPGR